MTDKIKAWSCSRYLTYEPSQGGCPFRAKLKFIERLPETQGPAAARGEKVHLAAQHFVEGKIKTLPSELKAHTLQLKAYKAQRPKPDVELKLALSEGFEHEVDWFDKDAWCRAMLDLVSTSDGLEIVDYKTGRVYAKKHALQEELYALFGLKLYDVDELTVRFLYTDLGPTADTETVYGHGSRSLTNLERRWHTRTKRMLSDTTFKANPHPQVCRWCSYGVSKGGPCKKERR